MSKTKKLTVGLLVTLVCTILFTSTIFMLSGTFTASADRTQNYCLAIDNVVQQPSNTESANDEYNTIVEFYDGIDEDDDAVEDAPNHTLLTTSLLIVIVIIIFLIFLFLGVTIVPGIVVLIVFKVRKRKRAENELKTEEGKAEDERNNINGSDANS